MAAIEFAPEVLGDLDQILEHLQTHDVAGWGEQVESIIAAVDLLAASPLIGSPVQGTLRELVIGRGSTGYIALYRFEPVIDTVFVLAIRSQRKAGWT